MCGGSAWLSDVGGAIPVTGPVGGSHAAKCCVHILIAQILHAGLAGSVQCVVAALQVTSYKLAMRNSAEAVSGPTAGDDGLLGTFSWQGPWAYVAHRGMPEVFDFDFELQQP